MAFLYPNQGDTGSRLGSLLGWCSIGGIASLGVSAALFYVARHTDTCIMQLDCAKPLETLAAAAAIEDMLPMLVAVRGRLTCLEPTKCELSGSKAVMRELLQEDVYIKERSSGRMVQEAFEVRRETEQREALLEDLTGRLRVDNLQHAAGLRDVMELRQRFAPADARPGSLMEVVVNKAFKNMIKHGVRFTERFLPLDTTVTIVGELARDSVGAQRHQRHQHQQQQQQQQHTTSALPAKLPDTHTASPSLKTDPHGPQRDAGGGSAGLGPGVEDAGRSSSGEGASGSGRGAAEGRGRGGGGGGVADVVAVAAGEALAGQAAAAAVRMLPYALHMPQHGPFHVTTLTLAQLRSRLTSASRALTYCAWGFGALGAALCVRKVVLQLWRARQARRVKQRLAEAEAVKRQRAEQRAAAAGGGGAAAAGGEEHSDDGGREPGVCVICLDQEADMVFNCGHLCTCSRCTAAGQLTRCPVCRASSRPFVVYRVT